MRGLFRYEQKETIIHSIDPRVKLIWVFSVSTLTITAGVPWVLLAIFLSTLPFWAMLRPSGEKIRSIAFVLFTMVFGFMISQSLFYYWGETPTFTIIPATFPVIGPITGGIHVYAEGAVYGFIQSFRFMASVSAALLLVATTHPSELIAGLVRFIRIGKRDFGFPGEIAFMVSSAVSFAPSMIEESLITINAMQVRGLKMKGITNKIIALKYLFFPLVINILRTGRQMAIAADSRAFRATKHRTYLNELKLGRPDYIFLSYIFVFMSTGLYLSFTGYGGTVPGS
ncbi:MAG TPA: energy-coupling factor transporter transmembrane protein EcfT [Methanosarcinales archaeon]|nr:Energy-coupling factor transporter transmembrane protein EcfT [ANME-2 cluster archaeon]HIH87365.1 energy-coupling factor transporter transmembrane protein EcfT [Methanosarcinales archaeon]